MPNKSKRQIQLANARKKKYQMMAMRKQAAALAIKGNILGEESGENRVKLESGQALEETLPQEASILTNNNMLQLKELIQQSLLRRYILRDDNVCLSDAVSDFIIEIDKPEPVSPRDDVENEKHFDGRPDTSMGLYKETIDDGSCSLDAVSDYNTEKMFVTGDSEDFTVEEAVKQEPIILQDNFECRESYDEGNEGSISFNEQPYGNDSLIKHCQENGKKSEYGLVSQKEATIQPVVSMLHIDKQVKTNIPQIDMPQGMRTRKRTWHETKGNRHQRHMNSSLANSSEIRKILTRTVTTLHEPLPPKTSVNDSLREGQLPSGITAQPSTSQDFSPPMNSEMINHLTILADDSLTKHSQENGKKSEYGHVSQKEAAMQPEVSMLQIDKQVKTNIPKRDMHQGNRHQRDVNNSVAQSSKIRKILPRTMTIPPKPLPPKAYMNEPLRVGLMPSGITAQPSTGQDSSPPTNSDMINHPSILPLSQSSSMPLLLRVQNLAVVSLSNLLLSPKAVQSNVSQPAPNTFLVISPSTRSTSSASSPSVPPKGLFDTGTSSVSQTLKYNTLHSKEPDNHMTYSALHQNNIPPNINSPLSSSRLHQALAGAACISSPRRSNCSSGEEFQSETQLSHFSVSTSSSMDFNSSSIQNYLHSKLPSSGSAKEIDNLCDNSSFTQRETACSEESYHYSSEDESDVLEDKDLDKGLQELNHDYLKALIIRQRNNRTMYLIKNAHKFSVKKDGLYCCNICQVYYTNGLFRMSKHLQKHDLNS